MGNTRQQAVTAGAAVAAERPVRNIGAARTPPGTLAAPLQAVATGILDGAAPLRFMDSINAGNRQLGNRAFLHWVSELQFGPKPRGKKKEAKVAEAGATPEVLPETMSPTGAATGPEVQEAAAREEPGTASTPMVKKKKKKSRGQAMEKSAVPPVKKKLGVREKELFECCYDGKAGRLKYLLRHGHFDINASNRAGTMLGTAAYFGYGAVLQALLSVPGINVNLLQQGGYTPLYVAVDRGREEIVRLLTAECRVDVNLGMPGKYTPLHNAVERNNVKIIQLLLANPGINVNARKPNGATPLLIATQYNLPGIVELLLERGADVNLGLTEANYLPLLIAAIKNHLEVVRLLLQQADIRVNEKTGNGLTALSAAAREGHEEVVRLLLEKGADPDISLKDGTSPLHFACVYRHPAILAMLLDAGADIHQVTSLSGEELTVFEIALLVGDRELISMVEEHLENNPDWSTPPTTPAPEWSTPRSTPPPDWFAGSPSIPPPESSATLSHAGAVEPTPAPPPVPRSADTGTTKPPDTKPATSAAERTLPDEPVSRSARAETQSSLSTAKNSLITEVLKKLDNETLDPAEGIWLMADVRNAANIDMLCVIYNRLAGMERERRRTRRHRSLRHQLLAEEAEPALSHTTPRRYTVGNRENLGADAAEVEIRKHLAPAHHKFISQAVNDMEFGRGKPTSGYPGLLHASAGIPGVGSCSVFYHTDVERQQNRIVGIGHHLDRETYQLYYAAGELQGCRTIHLS